MKFSLGTAAVWWPIIVNRPDPEKPGKTIPLRLEAHFLPLVQDEFLAEQDKIAAIKSARGRAAAERAYLATTFDNWRDVEDEDGAAVPFSPSTLAAALQDGPFRHAVWQALGELTIGEEARLGN